MLGLSKTPRVFSISICIYLLSVVVFADAPKTIWENRIYGTVSTSLVESEGVIYFGTSGRMLYGLNSSTGSIVLNYSTGSGVYSTPAVDGDLIVFGSDGMAVYGLNKSSGQTMWTYLSQGRIRSSPTIFGDLVYVGSDDNRLYALDRETGKLRWSFMLDSQIQSTPLIDGWRVLFGSSDRSFYSLSSAGGAQIWNVSTRGMISGQISDFFDLVIFSASDRRLYALDKYSGDIIWNYSVNQSIYGSPTVFGEIVYFSWGDGYVSALDAKFGGLLWEKKLNETVRAGVYAGDGLLYAGTGSYLTALDPLDGEILWVLNLTYSIKNPPISSGGRIFIPEGPYVRSYGGSIDIMISDIQIWPEKPNAGSFLNIDYLLTNNGDSIADDFRVDTYFDLENISTEYFSLAPGQSIWVGKNITSRSGRHLIEVFVDSTDEVIETDESNNLAGILYRGGVGWSTFLGGQDRLGTYGFSDGFYDPTFVLRWRCNPFDVNLSIADLSFVDALGGRPLNSSCYTFGHGLFSRDKILTNLSCSFSNVTGFEMDEYEDLIRSFGRNLSVNDYKDAPKNFELIYTCQFSGNHEIPIIDPELKLRCRERISENRTVPLELGWSCSNRFESNYSISDYVSSQGYKYETDDLPEKGLTRDISFVWNFSTNGFIRASPVIADIDGSGDGLLEVVAGSYDGGIYLLDHLGRLLWQSQLGSKVNTLSTYDIDLDGSLEVLAGSDSGLACIDRYGSTRWDYPVKGGVLSAPLLVYLNSSMENIIVFGGQDSRIHGLNPDGKLIWDYKSLGPVASSGTVADMDGDGISEIIFGSDDNVLYILSIPPYKVWMFQTNADIKDSPKTIQRSRYSRSDIIVVSSEGKLYDIYETSAGSEEIERICTSEGCFRRWVSKTKLRSRWESQISDKVESSSALGDMEGDGIVEIVFGSVDRNLYVINQSGSRIQRYTTNGPIFSSPTLSDIDSDGILEILFGSDDGKFYILNSSAKAVKVFDVGKKIRSSAAVSDVDGDGLVDIVFGADDGRVYMLGRREKIGINPNDLEIEKPIMEVQIDEPKKIEKVVDLEQEIVTPTKKMKESAFYTPNEEEDEDYEVPKEYIVAYHLFLMVFLIIIMVRIRTRR